MRPVPIANPPNPWASTSVSYLEEAPCAPLQVFEDHTRQILARNDSPDVGFRFSVNPYRGCMHACAYCYARPTHEYLSFGSGTDFDRKIVVKPRAPELLQQAFNRPSWRGELVVFSGNTDCYQPIEASYGLTRRCLEVCAAYGNAAHVITKSALIERDIDVLRALAVHASIGVSVSIPFWNAEHARAIEPYVPTPQRRMKTVARLVAAGIRVTVNIAPVIPGLSDEDIGAILQAAHDAGARSATLIMLRLPGSVKEVFEERLRSVIPLRAERVLARTREVRGGKLNDPRFGSRHTGEGVYADSVTQLFQRTAERLGFDVGCPGARTNDVTTTFRRPQSPESRQPPQDRQLDLFAK